MTLSYRSYACTPKSSLQLAPPLGLSGFVIGYDVGQLGVQPQVELHQVREEAPPSLQLRALQDKLCEHVKSTSLLLKGYVTGAQKVVIKSF